MAEAVTITLPPGVGAYLVVSRLHLRGVIVLAMTPSEAEATYLSVVAETYRADASRKLELATARTGGVVWPRKWES